MGELRIQQWLQDIFQSVLCEATTYFDNIAYVFYKYLH